jgi:hypothetical protein
MQCSKCRLTGPKGEAHHHIIVENGKVVSVWYVSADGFSDRVFEKSEYFVEYRDEWLTPKLYEGKSMCELGECDCASNPACICCK